MVRPATHVSQVQEDLSGEACDTRVASAGGPVSQVQEDLSGEACDTRVTCAGGPQW